MLPVCCHVGQGRASVQFKSRETARIGIKRLHGQETLSGLRMRLFYVQRGRGSAHRMGDPWSQGGVDAEGVLVAKAAAGGGYPAVSPTAAAAAAGGLLGLSEDQGPVVSWELSASQCAP